MGDASGLPLFEWSARARRSDPDSSRVAAARASGVISGQARRVAAAVVEYPGRTSRELADLCVLDRYQVARRAPELEAHGWITRREPTPGAELRLEPTPKAHFHFGPSPRGEAAASRQILAGQQQAALQHARRERVMAFEDVVRAPRFL
jgi:hypothetical protein